MRWSSLIAAAVLVTGSAAEQFKIPAVQKVVNSALSKYHDYTAYSGPTGTAKAKVVKPTAAVEASDPGYWLADISHQGYAPYAGSGYTVFRNVMDYGAKGKTYFLPSVVPT
jgi:glucan 1,3-beta-glucosidase